MTHLAFELLDARAERFAVVPTIRLRVRVVAAGERIEAMTVRARVQIEPAGRAYEPPEELALKELFGTRDRWVQSVRPVQWTETAVTINAFAEETTFDVPVVCTYDLEVASSKYLSALAGGDIPIRLLFTGMVFFGAQHGFSVEMLPWNSDCQARIPQALWREAMDRVFPNQAWIRVDRSTFDALRKYRAEHALYNWNDTLLRLLGERMEELT